MFFYNMFNPKGFIYIYNKPPQESLQDEKICPNCGLATSEFLRTGKIGCVSCRDTFKGEIEKIITQIQGQNKFKGRIPKVLERENPFNLEETEEKLKIAIEEERYEDAAVYRDLIRSQGRS